MEKVAEEAFNYVHPLAIGPHGDPAFGLGPNDATGPFQLRVADPGGGKPIFQNDLSPGKALFDVSGPQFVMAGDVGGFGSELRAAPVSSQLPIDYNRRIRLPGFFGVEDSGKRFVPRLFTFTWPEPMSARALACCRGVEPWEPVRVASL